MPNFQLLDDEKCDFSVSGLDDQNNPVPIDPTTLVVTVADPSIATATVSDNVITVTTTGKLGTTQLAVTDGNVSAPPFTFDVVASELASLGIAPGAPTKR